MLGSRIESKSPSQTFPSASHQTTFHRVASCDLLALSLTLTDIFCDLSRNMHFVSRTQPLAIRPVLTNLLLSAAARRRLWTPTLSPIERRFTRCTRITITILTR